MTDNHTCRTPSFHKPLSQTTYYRLIKYEKIRYSDLYNENIYVDPITTQPKTLQGYEGNMLFIQTRGNTDHKLKYNGHPKKNIIFDIYDKSKMTKDEIHAAITLSGKCKHINLKAYETIVTEVASLKFAYSDAYPKGGHIKFEPEITPERPVPGPVDEELYRNFKRNLDTLKGIKEKPSYVGHTLKTGPCRAIDRWEIRKVRKNKKHSDNIYTPIAVGILPKYGTVTSDGQLRKIYPMSVDLQRIHEAMFGDKKFVPPPGITRVYGPKFPKLKYSYDIAKMDKTIYPYIYRYAEELDLLDIFLPIIISRETTGYIDQMPSGIYPTAEICACFSSALCETLKIEAHIQGDGILTSQPIEHIMLRQEPDYVINGFSYHTGQPTYVNGKKKLNSPRIVANNTGNEQEKKNLRHMIYYDVLKGKHSGCPEPTPDNPYRNLTTAEILKISTEKGVCRRLITYWQTQTESTDYGNSWDTCDTMIVTCRTGDDLPWGRDCYLG